MQNQQSQRDATTTTVAPREIQRPPPSPAELYRIHAAEIDMNAGFVYVTFMREDARKAPVRFEDRLTVAYRDREVERGVFGCFGDMLREDLQLYVANFGYTHCEVVFVPSDTGKARHGADVLLAVYVNTGENVAMRWRHFDDRYEWTQLRANATEIDAMLQFACLTYGERFSAEQRNAAVLHPGAERRDGWYCTKHAMSILRALDCPAFHLNRTNTLNVDEFHALVSCCGHTPPPHLLTQPPVVKEAIFGRESMEQNVYRGTARPLPQRRPPPPPPPHPATLPPAVARK
jgi:hypothetical protein